MAQAIRPQAYSQFSNSVYRRSAAYTEWDPAVLKVLVELLVGSRVVVETDTMTGHAVEAEVVGWHDTTLHSNFPHVRLRVAEGALTTSYPVYKMGTIMDLGNSNARWKAMDILRERAAAATKAVRQHLGADWVIMDGQALNWRSTHQLDGAVTVQAVYPRGEAAGIAAGTWYVGTDGHVEQGSRATGYIRRGKMTFGRS